MVPIGTVRYEVDFYTNLTDLTLFHLTPWYVGIDNAVVYIICSHSLYVTPRVRTDKADHLTHCALQGVRWKGVGTDNLYYFTICA